MAVSNLLEILAISESQTEKATAINTAISQMEQALADTYTLDTSSATTAGTDIVIPFDDTNDLTQRTALRFMRLVLSAGATAAFNVIHPDNKHMFVVVNNTTETATIKTASGTGTTVAPLSSSFVYCDGVDVSTITVGGSGGGSLGFVQVQDDISVSSYGPVPAATVIGSVLASDTLDFSANFAGSVGYVGTPPAAPFTIDIKDDGTIIGAVSISTAGVVSFSTAGGTPKTVAAGSLITFETQATPDSAIQDVMLTVLTKDTEVAGTATGQELQGLSMVGVNTTAALPDRLSVKSDGALFTADTASISVKVDKAAVADTASILFQDGGSGRAEVGLIGDDNFTIKVSSDNVTWRDGITVDAATGYTSLLGVSGRLPVYNTGNSVFIGEGAGAVDDLTTNNNVFVGYYAGFSNTSGAANVGIGSNSLKAIVSGADNVAAGRNSMAAATTAIRNVAMGSSAMAAATSGSRNVAMGHGALLALTTAGSNTAVGYLAMAAATTGYSNTAIGREALTALTTGYNNVTVGRSTFLNLTDGYNNIAIGNGAGRYDSANNPLTSSNTSVFVGHYTKAGGSAAGNANETVIGYNAVGNGSNTVTIGNGSVTGAFVQVAWTVVSDKRDKEHIGAVPYGLDFVRALKPAAFKYKETRDGGGTGPVRYGFYAQDVLDLESDPVIVDARDADKLRMNETALIPVLVNAIKELSAQVDELKYQLEELRNVRND